MRDGIVEVILRLKDQTAAGIQGFMGRWKALRKSITDVAKEIGIVVGAIVAAIAGLTKLGIQGAKFAGIQAAFARTTDDSAAALERLREASGGTITDLDLMARHNQALALGTARSTEEFARMLRVSDALGKSLGVDGVEAMNKLADVMASGSQRAARALGIEIEAGMTRNQILERAEEVANRIKGEMGEGTEAADRFWTSVKNGKDRISEMVASMPAVALFFDVLTKGVNLAVGAFEKLAKVLGLLPDDFGAAAAGGGGDGGAAAVFGGLIGENPVTFRDMGGFGVSAEGLATFREREAARRRRLLDPFTDPNVTAQRFAEREGIQSGFVNVVVPGVHDGVAELENATEVFVDSMGRMGDAAIEESARMSDAIIGSLRQVIANIRTSEGTSFGSTLFGGLLGVGLGLFGALMHRGGRKDPVPVAIHDVSDRAAEQLREKGGPPLRVTTIVEQAGVEVQRIQREFYSRQGRDEVIRYSPVSGDFLRGS